MQRSSYCPLPAVKDPESMHGAPQIKTKSDDDKSETVTLLPVPPIELPVMGATYATFELVRVA